MSDKHHIFQTRVPREMFEKLEALLREKYAPMKPPSLNSVVLHGLEWVIANLEAEKGTKK